MLFGSRFVPTLQVSRNFLLESQVVRLVPPGTRSELTTGPPHRYSVLRSSKLSGRHVLPGQIQGLKGA